MSSRTDELKRLHDFLEAGKAGLEFEEEGKRIIIVAENGARVPLGQIFYRFADSFAIGEVVFAHALIQDSEDLENDAREVVIPLVILAVYEHGQLAKRIIKPYVSFKRPLKFELDGRPVFIEARTRYSATLDTLMSLQTARSFVEGTAQIPDWKEVYDMVLNGLRRFICMDWDPRLYDVVACWIIATYFQEIFSVLPFLYPYGPTGTGKTRLLKTAIYMSRHGFVVTDPSDATIYRLSEALKPSLGVDESLLGKDAWKLVRTAFKKGMYVPRIEKTRKEEFVLGLFETFMPVAFSAAEMPSELGGLDADEARCIFIFMQQRPDPIGRDPEAWDFSDVRDKLYLIRLGRAGDVIRSQQEIGKNNFEFVGHEREIWLPLLAIARLINRNVYNNVLGVATDLHGVKVLQQNPDERIIVRALLLLFRARYSDALRVDRNAHVENVEFTSSGLRDYVRATLEEAGELDEDLFKKKWSAERIGRILTRLGIFKRIKKGRTHYIITPTKLRSLYSQFMISRACMQLRGGDVGDVRVKVKGDKLEGLLVQLEKVDGLNLKQASLSDYESGNEVKIGVTQGLSISTFTSTTPTSPTLSLGDAIQEMRLKFAGGTLEEFLSLACRLGLSKEEANSLFKILVRDGLLALAPDGKWRWIR
jgi:hypothetical protein